MSSRHKAPPKAPPEPEIQLVNPVAEHYGAFVAGNACQWETMALRALQAKAPDAIDELNALDEWWAHYEPTRNHLLDVAAFARDLIAREESDPHVVLQDSAKGQHIVICGAGPSLRETAAEWCPKADQLWGCNSALTWLADQGYRPTHGLTVDQTPAMLEEWQTAPEVEYLVASTVHPHLVEFLMARGRGVRFFHNFVGIMGNPVVIDGQAMLYEDWMYALLFPTTIRAGSGLNTVSRAIDVAMFMGAAEITVLGADCALRVTGQRPDNAPMGSPAYLEWMRQSVEMHADGGHALTSGATATTVEAEIDGRKWLTKPDMAVTASFLVQMVRRHPEIRLVGDTLPVALLQKPAAYLDRLPHLTDSTGKPIKYAA